MFTIKEILEVTEGKLINPPSQDLNSMVRSISIDSRLTQKDGLFIAIKGDRFDGHDFIDQVFGEGAKVVLVENENLPVGKTKPASLILVKDTKLALGKLANFSRRKFNPTVIAITGSNGKTTTKDMIHHLINSKFSAIKNEGTKNNHIGLPLTLLNLQKDNKFAVLEMGTNHFGEISYLSQIAEPNIGVITNIGNSHLEYFQNQENILKEKVSIAEHFRPNATLVINQDDKYLSRLNLKNIVTFGFEEKADFSASQVRLVNGGYDFILNKKHHLRINSVGVHNVYNSLAAIAVARSCGINFDDIKKALSTFSFPRMRLEFIRANEVEIINDAYNSNPDSLKAAVDALVNLPISKRKIIVTADMLELGKESAHLHKDIGKYIAGKKEIDILVSVGNFAQSVAEGAVEKGMQTEKIKSFDSLDDSIEDILSLIKPGDALLVKGSRLMQMERLVEALKENFK